MMAAIGFNNQPLVQADEVSDIVIDRERPSESEADEALDAQYLPQAVFSIGRSRTHFLGAGADLAGGG
ncbi:hypothetical protein RQX22_03315 [Sphingosinicella sp. GR2756]|uniref:Uncharacterized protein n=1 Tax=Sphingosinicella rhizophila TaxID=3050082 RepID=A0ABU3Q3I9_9SPHN|nr:hypothetical protein [Sphingosinicella sp. GR2756]MDT9597976.1 hypothetical protein [Sphingosinicella sp. GR2756]